MARRDFNCEQAEDMMKKLLIQNKNFWISWGVVFILSFASVHFTTVPASAGNAEQWVNLTNSVFYGNQDIIFSYGPLYWLVGLASSMYSSAAYILAKIFISCVYSFFWAMLINLIIRYKNYILFPIIFLLFIKTINFSQAFFLLPLIFVYYLEYGYPKPINLKSYCWLFVGLYSGFSFYIRFFYGLLGTLCFGSYLFSKWIMVRKDFSLLYLISGIVISYLSTGLIVFHNKLNIINYFIINNQLNFGNSVDMTLNVINPKLGFILAAISLIILNIYIFRNNKKLILPINILFIVFFKMGFSRADHYFGYFILPTVIVGLLLIFNDDKLYKTLFIVFISCIAYIADKPAQQNWISVKPFNFGVDFHQSYVDRMANAYAMYKLDNAVVKKIGQAAIDVYPYNNEYMFANKFNYQHRPNFQNYMTLTPKLDEMNKSFFENERKPQFVLWTSTIFCMDPKLCNVLDDFDEKYILNDDPLTSSAILLNYHFFESAIGKDGSPIAIFERNADTTKYTFKKIKSQEMSFNKWYGVPQVKNGVVKLIPNLKFTMYGRLKNLLFRGDILYVNYKFADGNIRRYRVNILNAQSGIWINPYVKDLSFNGEDVVSIMLSTTGTKYFVPVFTADWIQVPISGITRFLESIQDVK